MGPNSQAQGKSGPSQCSEEISTFAICVQLGTGLNKCPTKVKEQYRQ